MKLRLNDTIAAIATPSGEGAIAVIRISGPASIQIADRVFRGGIPLAEVSGFSVHYGIVNEPDQTPVDQVLATVFRSPHSYTGEDQVEISCHGGMYIAQRVLNVLIAAGARQAEAGEFTRRAFVNGKIDLAQAEAIADMIRARSEKMRQASFEQLQGRLGDRVRALRAELMDLCSLLEVDLDFSEEGLAVIAPDEIEKRLVAIDLALEGMVSSFEHGKLAREGVEVVLVGKPNAGKSSIFNALLKEERAIVTPLPGTTRDSLEENLTIGGMLFRVHDTAGLRESKDLAETEGVKRSQAIMERADILLDVIDAATPLDREEVAGWRRGIGPSQHCLAVYNKIDLVGKNAAAKLVEEPESVAVSARTGEGLDELRKRLVQFVQTKGVESVPVGVTNRRHAESLIRAREGLSTALESLKKG
ncbi:tRNA uridine-5-carboxymethylaminomethyl(34) synthesis GTPase MnmE, partial [bacterium]